MKYPTCAPVRMVHPLRTCGLLAVCMLTACDMFDPALYQRAERLTEVADTCSDADVPVLGLSTDFVQVALDPLADDWQLDKCGQGSAVGHDGFLAVELEAGRKVHVHVNALDPVDPVVYIVAGCDERNCKELNVATGCPSEKEHLSFIPPRSGRYFVGIDSAEPGGGAVEVLALAPICGDGTTDHSEACEDGNQNSGDGCDAYCRNELVGSEPFEVEANDDLAGGNVVAIDPQASLLQIHGRADGPCDPDVFSFHVPEARLATIALTGQGAFSCHNLGSESTVTLRLFRGLTLVGEARAFAGAPCPTLPATELYPDSHASSSGVAGMADTATANTMPSGTVASETVLGDPTADGSYHIQVTVESESLGAPIDYTLEIALEPAGGEQASTDT